jgi:hypothetical protein
MDAPGAAFHRLHREPSVLAVVDTRLYRHRLPVVIEHTGMAAAVLSQAGAWTSANRHNSARFPKLRLEIYQDSSENAHNAESRAHDTWLPFDRILHIPRGIDEMWGEVRVIACNRVGDAEIFPVNDAETSALLVCDYQLTLG